jgi:hypothetical protein
MAEDDDEIDTDLPTVKKIEKDARKRSLSGSGSRTVSSEEVSCSSAWRRNNTEFKIAF